MQFSKMQFSKMHFSKMHFSKMHFPKMHFSKILQIFGGLVLGCIKTKFCKKYAFDSIFQVLQDLHTSAPLQIQNFSKKLRKSGKTICFENQRLDSLEVKFQQNNCNGKICIKNVINIFRHLQYLQYLRTFAPLQIQNFSKKSSNVAVLLLKFMQ